MGIYLKYSEVAFACSHVTSGSYCCEGMTVRISDLPESERPRSGSPVWALRGLNDQEPRTLVIRSGGRGTSAMDLGTVLFGDLEIAQPSFRCRLRRARWGGQLCLALAEKWSQRLAPGSWGMSRNTVRSAIRSKTPPVYERTKRLSTVDSSTLRSGHCSKTTRRCRRR